MLKLGSLFDGSGGFPLAGSLCGIVPVWAAEVEPYPIAVTRSRFPGMRHLGDISKINGAEIEPVDVITFGSPCQDLSVAGKRAGLKHADNGDEETTRSGLFMEAVRIIKEMRKATNGIYPRFALWENVPGAFSSNKGEDFRIVLQELIQIVEPAAVMPAVSKNGWPYADSYCGDGWSLAYRVFDAQYWGVPQRRRRIHLVVDFAGQCARQVCFEREGVRGYFGQSGTQGQAVAADAERGSGAAGCEGNSVIAIDQQAGKGGANYAVGVMPTICSDSHGTPHAVVYAVDQGGGKSGANFHHDLSPTLTCTHGGEPVVCYPAQEAAPIPYMLKMRSGCDGGGKGALIQEDKSATLATNNDQYLFQPVKNQYLFENHSQDTRYKGPLDVCPMLPAQLGTGGNNTPFVVEGKAVPVCYKETYQKVTGPLMANSHPGSYCGQDAYQDMFVVGKEQMPIVLDRAFFNQGQNAQYDPQFYTDGTVPTLIAKGPAAVCVRYIVRRLTPTECARLQGFADRWGEIDEKESMTPEEYAFWLEVRNTHAAINGKAVKEYTEKQMLTWYNKLHTDSAEYKMWGNGIALPPALYCMQGIVDALGGATE